MEKNNDLNVNGWVDEHLAKLNPNVEFQPDTTRAFVRFEERLSAGGPRKRSWIWVTAAAMVGCFTLLAFPAPRAACIGACEALFARRMPASGQAVAGLAPDFTLKDAGGADLRLSSYRGKVVLLNFWATWCAPCKAEVPWFTEFERSYGDRGFAVIGVSMDEGGWQPVKPYLEAAKINYRVAIGDEKLAHTYGGMESLPETLLIDREGRIAARHVGLVSKSDYEREIVRLLKE
jgi:peroxiredoxin